MSERNEYIYFRSSKSNEHYHIGVVFPTLKDPYWESVYYGIQDWASELGVSLVLCDAGGYSELAKQKADFSRLVADPRIHGILLGSISYTGMDRHLALAREMGKPVVGLVNDIYSGDIHAKALVSFLDMGREAGAFLVDHARGRDRIVIAFFPGPLDAGWSPESLRGFLGEMSSYEGLYTMLPPRWGDTDSAFQRKLIREVLEQSFYLDYIVGNAVAAEAAAEVLAEMGRQKQVGILSTYLTPGVYRKIADGRILAAPCDRMTDIGRMGLDMIVRVLEGQRPGVDFPFRAGPLIPIISADTHRQYPFESLFAPEPFQVQTNCGMPLEPGYER